MSGYATGGDVLWPCPFAWSDKVTETLAWLTDVMVSRNATQQRRQVRLWPRRSFSFTQQLAGDARRLVEALRFDLGARQLVLPVLPDVQLLGDALAGGAAAIACRTAGFDFVAGGRAVLWSSVRRWELVTIASITEDGLTLSAPTVGDYARGDRLYPVRLARLQAAPRGGQRHADYSVVQVEADVIEDCQWPAAWPSAAAYRGRPVLEWRTDESDDPTDEFDRTLLTLDQDVGPVVNVDYPGMPFRVQSHAFKLWGRPAHTAFRSLAYALAGRAGELWVPSWQEDVQLLQDGAAADVTLQAAWQGYAVFGREQPNRRDLRIELYDGTVIYRRVVASAEYSDREVLTLDAALGVAVPVAHVRAISWMSLCTAASDTVEIEHSEDADGSAAVGMSWQAVRNDL